MKFSSSALGEDECFPCYVFINKFGDPWRINLRSWSFEDARWKSYLDSGATALGGYIFRYRRFKPSKNLEIIYDLSIRS